MYHGNQYHSSETVSIFDPDSPILHTLSSGACKSQSYTNRYRCDTVGRYQQPLQMLQLQSAWLYCLVLPLSTSASPTMYFRYHNSYAFYHWTYEHCCIKSILFKGRQLPKGDHGNIVHAQWSAGYGRQETLGGFLRPQLLYLQAPLACPMRGSRAS